VAVTGRKNAANEDRLVSLWGGWWKPLAPSTVLRACFRRSKLSNVSNGDKRFSPSPACGRGQG